MGDPHGLPPIACLTGRYPTLSSTFVTRELRELQRRGVVLQRFSLWRSRPGQLPGPVAREELEATVALLSMPPLAWLRVLGRCLLTHPLATARLFVRSQGLSAPGLRARAVALLWCAEALMLWAECRARGIRHVHVHLNGSAPAVAALAAGFGNDAGTDGARWSFSMTVHGSSEFYDVAGESLAKKLRAARFAVCISDYTRSQVMAITDEAEWPKLHVVRCGLPLDAHPVGARAAGGPGPLELLCVARLTRAKGLHVLLRAAAALSQRGVDWRLTVVGDGDMRARWQRLADALGLAPRVQWTGALDPERVRELFEQADVFCLPSFAEGVPVVVMEAMRAAVPVVATRIAGLPELVQDGVSGLLVTPSREDELSDALERLARDRSLRERLGRAGRQRVSELHDLQATVSQLMQVFAQYLGAAVQAPPRRVALVKHGALPVLHPAAGAAVGGEELQHVLLARALQRQGLDVRLVVGDFGQPRQFTVDGIATLRSFRVGAGLPVLRFLHPRCTGLWRALHDAHAQVVYVSCADMELALAALFCRWHRRRLVFRVASDADCDPQRLLIRLARDRWLYRWGLRRADAILVQTTHQQALLRRHFGLEARVARLFVEPSSAVAPAAPDIDVLWVANLRHAKRPDRALQLAAALPHRRFHLVGGPFPGEQALFERMRACARELPNVTWHGQVPYREVGALFDRCRVFLNTSDLEGFPNTFLQAWVRGRPVATCFDPDGLVARHGLGVSAADEAELKTGLEQLLDDDALWTTTQAQVRRWMSAQGGDETVVRPYLAAVLGDAADADGTADTGDAAIMSGTGAA